MNRIYVKNLLFYLIAFIIYLFISFTIWGLPLYSLNKVVLGYGGDPFQFIWGIKWVLYALIHNINPLISFKQLYPAGFNLTWSAGNVFTADFLALPITYKFGAIFSYNLWVILSPVLASMSALILNYYITKNYFASFVGGYVFGFSTYEIGQLLGHLHMFGGIFLIPLMILFCIIFYRSKINKTLFILIETILLVLLFCFSLEVFTSFTIFGYASIMIAIIIYKDNRKTLFKLSYYITISYILAAIVLLPFFYYLYIGLHFIPKVFNPASIYSSDILNYIIPTPITLIGGNLFSHISTKFTGNFSEEGAYLGLPLLIIFFIYIKKTKSDSNKKFVLWVLFIIFIASLGPYLNILSHKIIPMPWWLLDRLPIVANLLPTRFTLYIFLIFSIISSITLAQLDKKFLNYFLGITVVLFLIPNFNLYSSSEARVITPKFFNESVCKRYIKANSNVLIIPCGYFSGNLSALYQEKSNMYFSMVDNTSLIVPLKKWPWLNSSFLSYLIQNKPNLIDNVVLEGFFGYNKIHYIIINKDEYPKWSKIITSDLHLTPEFIDGIYLYKIPDSILNNKAYENYNTIIGNFNLKIFQTLLTSSQKFLSSGENLSDLYPQYLEVHGYLDKSFGYQTGPANNWTQNGGWIGQWACPNGDGKCFGVGLVGDIDTLKPIIDKYSPQALQIFFPYPKIYSPDTKETNGQLLMVFRAPNADNTISSLPYTIDFKSNGNEGRFIGSGFCSPENWGTWSCAKEVSLSFKLNKIPKSLYLNLYFHALVTPKHYQTFEFYLNNHLLEKETYTDSGDKKLAINISNLAQQNNTLLIKVPNAATPKSLGINTDTRDLGIGITKIDLTNR